MGQDDDLIVRNRILNNLTKELESNDSMVTLCLGDHAMPTAPKL